MTNPTMWLSALLVFAVIPQASWAQSYTYGIFSDMQTTIAPRLSPALESATLRTRVVQVDMQKITAARRGREILKLNLFDDAVVEVLIESVRPTSSGYYISGNPKGMEWGEVRLVVNGPVMVGTVLTPEGKFTIRSGGSGRHVIRQIDPSADPFECGVENDPSPVVPPLHARPVDVISSNDPMLGGAFSQTALQTAEIPTEDGSEVRVLVVYTPALQAQEGGAAGMKALVDLYVQSTNQAFEDSSINPRLVLAHSAMVDYVAGNTATDKSRLEDPDDGYMDEVHLLRNEYAADLVHLVKTRTGGAAGVATLMLSESFHRRLGFAVSSLDESVFVHETGHNFGVSHDRFYETVDNKIYPYAFGYENKRALEPGAPATSHWHTIMAYPNRCSRAGIFCEQLLRFSNPDQSFRGDPLGVSADSPETGLDGPADARRTINNTARWVGSFRSEACTDFTVSTQTPVVSVDGGQIRAIVNVDAGYGCIWDVASQSEFLTVTSPSRASGEGFVSIEVEANRSGVERNGVLTVAGTTITVRQLAIDEGICSRTAAVHSAIKRALGLTCDIVSDKDLAKVQTLELSDQDVSSLKADDFQGLTGLTHLSLDSNQLIGLPADIFAGLTSLESVDLSENLLTEVPEGLFTSLSSLISIDLRGNPLTELPEGIFEGLTTLEHLYLDGTRNTRLRAGLFRDLSKLESLNLGGSLVELPAGVFTGLSSLKRLYLAGNQLTTLPLGVFDGLSSLDFLRINGSRITTLPLGVFDGLSSLVNLSIGGTRITDLPVGMFNGLSNLRSLHLNTNDLTDLPLGLFVGLSRLQSLGLSRNDLTSLPDGLFTGLTALRYLHLHQNDLAVLPSGLFTGLTALQDLGLSQNDLTDLPDGLFTGMTALERLDLDRNSLSSLRAGVFSGPGRLLHLDLSFNELSKLPDGIFNSLTELKTLNLDQNKVFPIPLPLSLEKVADSQFKAVAPAGAPFALVLPVSVSIGGEIESDAGTITIAAGATESTPLGLTRTAGMDGAVSVDIGMLPGLPGDHRGYILTKEESLPLVILESHLTDDAMLIDISVSGVGIQPVFSTDTRYYEAIVANGVSSLSVITMTSNPGATVTFLDESDSVLEDTDGTRDGHQVNLSVGENIITLKITSEDGSVTEEYTLTVIRDGAMKVCARTTQVREAIVAELQGTACSEITDSQLSSINGTIGLSGKDIFSLQSGDFKGLNALRHLFIDNNPLSSLPSGVFSGLTNLDALSLSYNHLSSLPSDVFAGLTTLEQLSIFGNHLSSLPSDVFTSLTSLWYLGLSNNHLSSLPSDVFADLSALEELRLSDNHLSSVPADMFAGLSALEILSLGGNTLSSLPADVFADLHALEELSLHYNRLSSLPSDVFAGLTALEELNLYYNHLSSLPADVFAGLTALEELDLRYNRLSSLPPDVFAGLTALEELIIEGNNLNNLPADMVSGLPALRYLELSDNLLSSLPEGIFSGLTGLEYLALHDNTVDPLPLPVSLEKVGDSQFKAVAPTGTPFSIEVAVSISSSGAIDGGAGAVSIPAGAVESTPLGVSRIAGTEDAVTVNTGDLPAVPDKFYGIILEKDETLPREILAGPKAPLPGQVMGLEVTLGVEKLDVSWTAVTEAGGYTVQWKSGDLDYDESRQAVIAGGDTLGHTIADLTAGTEYTVRVYATRDNADDGPPSSEVIGIPKFQPPAQVTGVEITAGNDQLDVSWTAVTEAGGYIVQWKSGDLDYDESRQAVIAGGDTLGHTIADLTAGTEYTVRVFATRDNADDGPPSSEVIGIPKSPHPSRVTGVEVAAGVEKLDVSWTAVTEAGGYTVQWKSGDLDYDESRQAVIAGGDTLGHTIADLTAGTEYTVRVYATRDNADDGPPSSEVIGIPKFQPPAQVTGVEITAGNDQLDVSWTAVTEAGGYIVQWKSGDLDYDESRQAVIAGGDTLGHTIADLTAGTEYTVRVFATRDNADDGPFSSEVTGIPKFPHPSRVTGVEIAAGVEKLEVSWTAVTDAGGYTVQWKTGDLDYDESRQAVITGSDTLSHTIADLTAGTEYTVRVYATRDNADDGPPSSEVTGIPKFPPPARVTGVEIAAGIEQLDVTWTAVSDAGGYTVQWKSGDLDYDESRQAVITGGDTLSHTIADLMAGTEYTIRVFATRDNADDGPPSIEVTGIPASVNPDVNGDGMLDGDDALVMYYAYESSDQLGDGETGGTAKSRQTLLSGLAGTSNPDDDDLKDMIRKANVWREVGVDAGGDINEDGEIDGSDAVVMIYAYSYKDLVGNGVIGGTARFRSLLLAEHASEPNPSDDDLKAMLRRANKLRNDFG